MAPVCRAYRGHSSASSQSGLGSRHGLHHLAHGRAVHQAASATETLAYEHWEDLGFRAPDNILIPTGAGSNVLGCDIGFCKLLRRGEIRGLPRLFAVQPENCAPLRATFLTGGSDLVAIEAKPTIAEGTSIAKPVRTREVLAAVRRSGGATVTVSESEIVAAHGELAQMGLYVEPTSGSTQQAPRRWRHPICGNHCNYFDRQRAQSDAADWRALI